MRTLPWWVLLATVTATACGGGKHDDGDVFADDGPPLDADPVTCAGRVDSAVQTVRYDPAATGAADLTSLDVYGFDANDCGPAPVVVYVHGGAWTNGDKANRASFEYKAPFFREHGFVYVSVNYRLSPGVMHPTHIDDLAHAAAWIAAHIDEYGGDPTRVAIIGHSAGAHLVSLLATNPAHLTAVGGLPLSALKCTISVDSDEYDLVERLANGDDNQKASIVQAFGTSMPVLVDGSPIKQAVAGRSIAPFLVMERGTPDRKARAEMFVAALRAAGSTVQTLDGGGLSHDEINAAIGMPGETLITPPLLAYLQQCLQ